mgnify:CR=1 FL=1
MGIWNHHRANALSGVTGGCGFALIYQAFDVEEVGQQSQQQRSKNKPRTQALHLGAILVCAIGSCQAFVRTLDKIYSLNVAFRLSVNIAPSFSINFAFLLRREIAQDNQEACRTATRGGLHSQERL